LGKSSTPDVGYEEQENLAVPANLISRKENSMATTAIETTSTSKEKVRDWTKPAAMAIPKEGYLSLENGRYGPVYPRTQACYGFTIIAKIKPGREDTIRAYGKTIEGAIEDTPDVLATLKLHYLRWVLSNIGRTHTSCTRESSIRISTSTPKMQ
jgi:hypothetical protein